MAHAARLMMKQATDGGASGSRVAAICSDTGHSTTSTRPTNNQQPQQHHHHHKQQRQQQQQQQHKQKQATSLQEGKEALSPSIFPASSFSFNSYHGIICCGSPIRPGYPCRVTTTSRCTFSASDVKRSLAARRHPQARAALATVVSNPQGSSAEAAAPAAKFRVQRHSRRKSIGWLDELAPRVSAFSVGDLTLNERQEEEERRQLKQKQLTLTDRPKIRRTKFQIDSSSSSSSNSNISDKQEEYVESKTMSSAQTLQSIHSLSMQLNRRSASQAEMSQLSSGPQSPMSTEQGAGNGASSSGGLSSSGGRLGRLMGKKATRVKELLLQNLGKADKTTDELFQMYEDNFYKQQNQALKLQKEFKSYVNALKGAQEASKSLNTCIQQSTGDYQSARHDLVCENLSQMEHLSDDLMEKLRGQLMSGINEYLSQFNELRDKIAKRRRKLIDFDSSRRVYELMLAQVNKKRMHNMQRLQQPQAATGSSSSSGGRSLRSAFLFSGGSQANGAAASQANSIQSATNQLVDEARLLKLREQYNYCKIMYETINSELHEELPMVYEKKMKHLLMTLQNYFSLEAQYHSNAGKLFATAGDVIDEIPMSALHSLHSSRRHLAESVAIQVAAGGDGGGSGPGTDLVDEYGNGNKATTSGSSGMGSSRSTDSSIESSSSPDGSQASDDGPAPMVVVVHDRQAMSGEVGQDGDDDDDETMPSLVVPVSAATGCSSSGTIEEAAQAAATNFGGRTDQGQEEIGESLAERREKAAGKELESVGAHHPGSLSGATGPEDSSPIAAHAAEATSTDNQTGSMASKSDGPERVDAAGEQLTEVAPVRATSDKALKKAEGVDADEKEQRPATNPICLYRVRTIYKYLAEDVDELCFEADEIIQVIEFDETQEQEEGWLLGVREVNNQRGLFPANFTRPI